jgi:hypothetical protein
MDALYKEDVFLIEEEEEEEEAELTPEEKEAEQAALADVKDDDLREKLAADLGIDPEEDSELLNKVVAREKAQRERLSGAIKQKISWREKAKSSSNKPDEKSKGGNAKPEIPDIEALVEQKLNERMEAQDLKSLELPDDLKEEVKTIAKAKGISIREAAQDPYIKFRKDEMEREERIKQASPKRSNKGTYTTNIDPSKPLNPSDFDLNTDEGRKAWKEAKAAREKHLSQSK